VAALHTYVLPMRSRGPTVDAERLALIANACRDHEGIRFKYLGRNGQPSARLVEPHRVVHTGYRWYLVAWDLGRKDWRTFRVDRIEGKVKTSVRFKPRGAPDGDFAAFVAKSLSQVPYPYRARVTLHAAIEILAQRIPPSAGVLEPIDEKSCVLHTGSHSLDSIAIHLCFLGIDFQVHEPPELVEEMRRLADRLRGSVSASSKPAITVS
jgi:predicted DNA-binding transcriptional regulator YafY